MKTMTLEKLAAMVQRGFAETATKADLEAMRIELRDELRKELASKEDLQRLREELISELGKVSVTWSGKYHTLREWVKDIDDRLMVVEGKSRRRT